MNKKKLLVLALVLILIASLSFGTLAWFSDSEEVTNQFMVAGSDTGNPDDIFSVDVWEDKDGDNQPDDDIAGEPEGLKYEDILPGATLPKTVYVENTGAYDQYIRVIVTISDKDAWLAAAAAGEFQVTDVFKNFDLSKWDPIYNNLQDEPNATEIYYVLYYKETLAPDQKITVFTDVLIPTSLTQQEAAAFGADGFTIDVKAQAVQTDNVGANAYEAFKTVNMGIGD